MLRFSGAVVCGLEASPLDDDTHAEVPVDVKGRPALLDGGFCSRLKVREGAHMAGAASITCAPTCSAREACVPRVDLQGAPQQGCLVAETSPIVSRRRRPVDRRLREAGVALAESTGGSCPQKGGSTWPRLAPFAVFVRMNFIVTLLLGLLRSRTSF